MEKLRIEVEDNSESLLKTIRIRKSLFKRIEDLSIETNVSINKILNKCIEYALDNLEEPIKEKKEKDTN